MKTRHQKRKIEEIDECPKTPTESLKNDKSPSKKIKTEETCSNGSANSSDSDYFPSDPEFNEEDLDENYNDDDKDDDDDDNDDNDDDSNNYEDIDDEMNTDEDIEFSDLVSDDETIPSDDPKHNIPLSNKQIDNIIKTVVKKVIKDNTDTDSPTIKKTEYNKFFNYIDRIYTGEFFERTPIEDKRKTFKTLFTEDQVKEFNTQLKEIHNIVKTKAPSVIDVLKKVGSNQEKQEFLEKIHLLANAETLSPEYDFHLKDLLKHTDDRNVLTDELVQLEKLIKDKLNITDNSYKNKILNTKMGFDNQCVAFTKLQTLESCSDKSDSEYSKYKNWMDNLLSINFGNYTDLPVNLLKSSSSDISSFLLNVREILDKHISFLEQPKDKIINFITQLIRNPNSKLQSIGIKGAPGLGKTSIVKSIAEALNRPYRVISLAGNTDSSYLSGHEVTYVGSGAGRIMEIIKECGVMNPIIYLDELDKVSTSEKGLEIIGFLTHLIDYTTNANFNYDKYFSGIQFDLSKVLFIFTYNDETKLDKIMIDRMYKINIDKYTIDEKAIIAQKHIVYEVLENFGFQKTDIVFNDEMIKYLIQTKTDEDGVRDLKRYLEILVSRINTISMLGENTDKVIKLDYKSIFPNGLILPITIDRFMIDALCKDNSIKDTRIEHMYS